MFIYCNRLTKEKKKEKKSLNYANWLSVSNFLINGNLLNIIIFFLLEKPVVRK